MSPRRPRLSGLRSNVWLPPLVAFGLLVLVWQLVATHEPPQTVATVPATLAALGDRPGLFWHDTLVTLQEMAVGLGASFVVAFTLAVVMVHVRVVERAIMPLAVVLNVTPVIAYAQGLVILFGFGIAPRYVVTGIIVFFPFLVNSLIGLRSVDREALDVLRTLDASRWEVLWRLRLPSSLPFLFAAGRICVPLAITGAVVAEFTTTGASAGLGSLIVVASGYGQVAVIYAAILVLAVLGLVLTLGVTLLERRLLSWHPSSS
ncbi:MAG: transporter permease [Acidimicrobiaceae bacterium]|jgi:NitT/TauT family transport system permease protein|nr:transporter permease [Acidimicrobiaceae bacterium]